MIYSFVSTGDFDNVEVILKKIWIKTADYLRLICMSCDKKTIVSVRQNIWVNLHFFKPLFCACHLIYILAI